VRSSEGKLIYAALCGLLAVAATSILTGCADQPTLDPNPNDGMFVDFQDGKFDGDGHPLNAVVTSAKGLCTAKGCSGAVGGGAQSGDLQLSARMKLHTGTATLRVKKGGTVLASKKISKRGDAWTDVPVGWYSNGDAITVELVATGTFEVDYFEVFPARFGLVASPGSGVIGDDDHLTIEVPRYRKVDALTLDGVDITDRLPAGTTTNFRTVIDVAVGDLLPERGDVADVMIHAGENATRLQLRRSAPACAYEGTGAKKVLITGFQPFPADASHGNVSGEAVVAMSPAKIAGARVMKLILPVEYDRAAAEVTDAIARCAPDIVISFGQGGGEIALEHTAYNLQDTGEVAGGVPDNRGIVRAAVPIDEAAPATRDTKLPLDAIEAALVALGESPQHSRDPGRYICNNVMFADIGTGRTAGFIHLPYTTSFDDAARARFGKVVAAAIQATVDQK